MKLETDANGGLLYQHGRLSGMIAASTILVGIASVGVQLNRAILRMPVPVGRKKMVGRIFYNECAGQGDAPGSCRSGERGYLVKTPRCSMPHWGRQASGGGDG